MATTTTEMKIQAVAHSYWRSIKRGKRTFESLSYELTDLQRRNGYSSMREQVLYLAKTDVVEKVITKEDFENYTGLNYDELLAE